MVLLAQFCLVILGHVLFFLKLPNAMSKRTLTARINMEYFSYAFIELTVPVELPVPTYFRLILDSKAYKSINNLLTFSLTLAFISIITRMVWVIFAVEIVI